MQTKNKRIIITYQKRKLRKELSEILQYLTNLGHFQNPNFYGHRPFEALVNSGILEEKTIIQRNYTKDITADSYIINSDGNLERQYAILKPGLQNVFRPEQLLAKEKNPSGWKIISDKFLDLAARIQAYLKG